MTRSTSGRRVPGATLLEIARVLFRDDVIAAVVQPTISDLQREVDEAGSNRLARLRAHARGYCAFWRLVLVAPVARWPAPAASAGTVTFGDGVRRLAVGFAALALVAIVVPVLGVWFGVVSAAGALLALVFHAWYERHPSDTPDPTLQERHWRAPQINFSSTDVAANGGGLIFVIGSLLIVTLALPSVVFFLLVAIAGGCVLAWALVTWRTNHPKLGLPETRIDGSARRA